MIWTKAQLELKKFGIPIADPRESYSPGGYPRLGLSPVGLTFSTRSANKVGKQLNDAEHKRGNYRFEGFGLGRMDVSLANEFASVYLALTQRYKGVYIDRINFCRDVSTLGARVLGSSMGSGIEWPTLHGLAYEFGEMDVRDVIARIEDPDMDPKIRNKARREASRVTSSTYHRDMTAHGQIDLSECFSHPKCYGTLQSYWVMRNAIMTAKGKPSRLVDNRVSGGAFVLLHEFGHVVDWAAQEMGKDAYAHVMEALERGLLKDPAGRWMVKNSNLSDNDLTRSDARLLNYPSWFTVVPGDGLRRRQVRHAVGPYISDSLGSYAYLAREEIFAEAFALSLSAKDDDLMERLSGFQVALRDIGIAVKRRQSAN